MSRTRRLKVEGDIAHYHVVSRTVGQQFLLGDYEKEKLLSIIRKYSELYFVKLIGYAILDNHFHLLVKMETGDMYSDKEILKRVKAFYKDRKKKKNDKKNDKTGGKKREEKKGHFECLSPEELRKKLGNLSEYVKGIKQTFSWRYNRENDRNGYFWSDRFKSVLIENGESLLNCLGYIDLNPVRAGIVQRPEDYRWCSLAYRVQQRSQDTFLEFEGLFDAIDYEKSLRLYREFVYHAGGVQRDENKAVIDESILTEELKRNFNLPKSEILGHRVRYFTDGVVLGSQGFISKAYENFAGKAFFKKEKKIHQTEIGKGIFSLRHLKRSSP